MEPTQTNIQSQSNPGSRAELATGHGKTTARDFFLNLGAIIALYTVAVEIINLLFTVINKAYPQTTTDYYSITSSSISFPVATIIIFFPLYVLLMWTMEKGYVSAPEKKQLGVRKWLTYITLFVAGLTLAGDLVTILYYFIDGRDLTAGFVLKVLTVLVVTGLVFMYYISDIREKLTSKSRKIWLAVASIVMLATIIWGFSVLGSPRTQQLLRYDGQKVSDLQNINSIISNYYQQTNKLPNSLADLSLSPTYSGVPIDTQTGVTYDYKKVSNTEYQLCATFNKTYEEGVVDAPRIGPSWTHPAGHYCFTLLTSASAYPKGIPIINY